MSLINSSNYFVSRGQQNERKSKNTSVKLENVSACQHHLILFIYPFDLSDVKTPWPILYS